LWLCGATEEHEAAAILWEASGERRVGVESYLAPAPPTGSKAGVIQTEGEGQYRTAGPGHLAGKQELEHDQGVHPAPYFELAAARGVGSLNQFGYTREQRIEGEGLSPPDPEWGAVPLSAKWNQRQE
jgi:hypothetical protein